MNNGGNVFEVFDLLSRACKIIEKTCEFIHDEQYGYITLCPSNLGTGLRASVLVRLEEMNKKIPLLDSIANANHV
jgi:protein-arginine kinase